MAQVPGDLIAKRMMMDPSRYAGVFGAFSSIVRDQGALGLFTGFGACQTPHMVHSHTAHLPRGALC